MVEGQSQCLRQGTGRPRSKQVRKRRGCVRIPLCQYTHMAPKRVRKPARRKPAATADVLGTFHRKERIPGKWKKHYAHLMRLRNDLLAHKNELIKDANDEVPTFSLHMADAATDSYDRDLALSRASSERGALYEIDQALDRIRNGTYGICEYTGKPIERRRLEAIPWTRFCAATEKELEQNGVIRPLHLAPREPVSEASLDTDNPTTLEEQLEEE